MELASVRTFVDDLPAAVKFYADVVGLKKTWDEPDVAIFGNDPVIVVEAPARHGDDETLVGRFTGIAFATGGIFLHVDDPPGNTVTFLQRPAHQS